MSDHGRVTMRVRNLLLVSAIGLAVTFFARTIARVAPAAPSTEAASNLKYLFAAEHAYRAVHHHFSDNMREIDFKPERGNQYTYFLGAHGPVERRESASLRPMTDVRIISLDGLATGQQTLLTALGPTNCPVEALDSTTGRVHPVGVSGDGADEQFFAVAVGTSPADPRIDCWTIASFTRVLDGGIPAGEPFNDPNDTVQ